MSKNTRTLIGVALVALVTGGTVSAEETSRRSRFGGGQMSGRGTPAGQGRVTKPVVEESRARNGAAFLAGERGQLEPITINVRRGTRSAREARSLTAVQPVAPALTQLDPAAAYVPSASAAATSFGGGVGLASDSSLLAGSAGFREPGYYRFFTRPYRSDLQPGSSLHYGRPYSPYDVQPGRYGDITVYRTGYAPASFGAAVRPQDSRADAAGFFYPAATYRTEVETGRQYCPPSSASSARAPAPEETVDK